MTRKRRLPRRALGVAVVNSLLDLLWFATPFIIALMLSGRTDTTELVFAATIPLSLVHAFLSHRRFRYGIDGDHLVVESGVLWRTRRSLPLARIHSVSLRATPLHRFFGVVEVSFEAVGASGADAKLPGVFPDEAERLQRLQKASGNEEAASETGAPPPALWQGGLREALVHGATDTRIGMGVGFLLVLWAVARDIIEPWLAGVTRAQASSLWVSAATGSLADYMATFVTNAAVVAAIAMPFLVALGWLASLAYSALMYGSFRIDRTDTGLAMRHGLAVDRQRRIPEQRLQVIAIESPPARRWLGYASVSAQTAGDAASNSAEGHLLLAPLAPGDQVFGLAGQLHPLADVQTADWHPVHRRTLQRHLTRAGLLLLALGTLAIAARSAPVAGIALAVATVDAARSIIRFRFTRYAVDDQRFVVRTGALWRRTWIVPTDKIQSVHVVQGVLSRRRDLAAVRVDTAGTARGSHVTLRYLRTADAVALAERLVERARAGHVDGV